MSEQLPPVGDYFGLKKRDIASEIRHNDEFWAAVAQAEVYLNADVSERDDDPTTQELRPMQVLNHILMRQLIPLLRLSKYLFTTNRSA